MSNAYDEGLQDIVIRAAEKLNLKDKIRPDGACIVIKLSLHFLVCFLVSSFVSLPVTLTHCTAGTYCFVSGPAYETKAECRFLRSLGGDSVGMSTIPEVIAAKHCGMKILGLSLITNVVVISKEQKVHASHAEVLQAVESSGKHVEAIVREVISKQMLGSYLSSIPPLDYTLPPLPNNPTPDVGATLVERVLDNTVSVLAFGSILIGKFRINQRFAIVVHDTATNMN